ncbi:MAG: glycosyltransferase [Candidatus Neomarinimicrobiota bacterium]
MSVIFGIALAFSLIYCASLLVYVIGLRYPFRPKNVNRPFVSVVIAAKNEEKQMDRLLASLAEQDYPADRYEIIIVDNESEDRTLEVLNEAARTNPKLQVLSTRGIATDLTHKKAAMNIGIEHAKGEIILTSDADGEVGPGWISAMAGCFDDEVGMVAGFCGFQYDQRLFYRLQALDFLMLTTAEQATLNLGLAWGCAGDNLAFRKSIFQSVGGYDDLRDRIGGDDSLFMQIVRRKARSKIVFAVDPRTITTTRPVTSIAGFIRQRARWATDANYMVHLNIPFFTVIVSTFIANLAPIGYFIGWLTGIVGIAPLGILIALKLIGEGVVAWRGTQLFRQTELRRVFILWFLFQPLYVALMGILSFWGNRMDWNRKRTPLDMMKQDEHQPD